MATVITKKMETFTVNIPSVDLERFKGIMKAMGWSTKKADYYNSPQFYEDIDKAEEDIANGNGVTVSSIEELNNLFL